MSLSVIAFHVIFERIGWEFWKSWVETIVAYVYLIAW